MIKIRTQLDAPADGQALYVDKHDGKGMTMATTAYLNVVVKRT